MSNDLRSQFASRIVEWAREQFAEEVKTGFRRAQTFDFSPARRRLAFLRERPPRHIQILSRVLPSEVLLEQPDSLERRRLLPPEEREVVERFCADLQADYRQQFAQDVERISYSRQRSMKPQFNAAVQQGTQLINEIASKADFVPCRAARGEWGLRRESGGLIMVVSFKLQRWMELQYGISILDAATMQSIWHNGQYLCDLGLTNWPSSWCVDNSDEFPQKLLMANEFAQWHLAEYRKLLAELMRGNGWNLALGKQQPR